jgi:hypothetical protein
MAQSKIVKAADLEISEISHHPMKKKPSGSKFVKMTYGDSKNNVMIQLNNVRIPFGISVYDKDQDNIKYSIECSLGNDEILDNFKNKIEELNKLNITHCSKNSQEWWSKFINENIIEEGEIYKNVLKKDPKNENPDRIKLKLPFYKGKPNFKVYNSSKEEIKFFSRNSDTNEYDIDWNWASNGMFCNVIFEVEGLWILDKKVFCTFRVLQLLVLDTGNKNAYAFIDDEEEEEDKENVQVEDFVF